MGGGGGGVGREGCLLDLLDIGRAWFARVREVVWWAVVNRSHGIKVRIFVVVGEMGMERGEMRFAFGRGLRLGFGCTGD